MACIRHKLCEYSLLLTVADQHADSSGEPAQPITTATAA